MRVYISYNYLTHEWFIIIRVVEFLTFTLLINGLSLLELLFLTFTLLINGLSLLVLLSLLCCPVCTSGRECDLIILGRLPLWVLPRCEACLGVVFFTTLAEDCTCTLPGVPQPVLTRYIQICVLFMWLPFYYSQVGTAL